MYCFGIDRENASWANMHAVKQGGVLLTAKDKANLERHDFVWA
jgi:hypothetical protein